MRNAPHGNGALAVDDESVSTVAPAQDKTRLTRQEYVRRLLQLGERHGELPIYGSAEWEALDPADPRRFASVVRAAECWRQQGEPDEVRWRLLEDDLLARVRLRLMSYDLAELPWQRIHDVNQARREAGDFRYRRAA